MASTLLSKRNLALAGVAVIGLSALFVPELAYADLDSSIRNVRSELSGVVLPTLSVIGLLMASFSYLTGNPNSKQHVTYALVGAALGFGAQSIIDFISSTIH